jgi:hypothetical protein
MIQLFFCMNNNDKKIGKNNQKNLKKEVWEYACATRY